MICRSALLVAALALGNARAQPPATPLPLDPLTARERALADTIARADSRVREFLAAGRSIRINVDFIAVKAANETAAQRDTPSGRHAEVLFYRYDTDQGLRVLVDLQRRAVVDIDRPTGASVPLSPDELALAARLALADRRVTALFGARMPPFRVATGPQLLTADSARIEGLRTLGATRDDPCFTHRCVVLFFRVNNQYVQMNRVFVDLTAQTVILRAGGQ
jgi:hypothetical protein